MASLIPNLKDRQMTGFHSGSFLDYPIKYPTDPQSGSFSEIISKSGKDSAIWDELRRRLDAKGMIIKEGMIQDATFIHSDPGHASSDTPRGGKEKTRRSKDGTGLEN